MPRSGHEKSSVIKRLKKQGKSADYIRSYLRGRDQVINRKGKPNDEAKRKHT